MTMRILITCDRYPGNLADGLTLRVFNYVSRLNRRHEFDLVYCAHSNANHPEQEALFQQVAWFPTPKQTPPEGFIARLKAGLDYRNLYPPSPAMRDYLARLASERSYDLIWDAGCNTLLSLEPIRSSGIPLLADQVDDSFLRLKRDIQTTTGYYHRLWLVKQALLHWLFSRKHLATAEAVLFVSKSDADSFKGLFPKAKTIVIENGVNEDYFKPNSIPSAQPTEDQTILVFEGVMLFQPNIEAACHMCHDIFPLVREAIPGARLCLVGRDPTPEVMALAKLEGVQVTGTVSDVRPFLQQANVFVCPMRSGTGIKNKILQAWAMGKAVVSTSAGIGGLQAMDGENILVRDHPQDFAAAVIELCRNPAEARRLGNAGRETVVSHYTWEAKALELETLMANIAHRSPANRPDEMGKF